MLLVKGKEPGAFVITSKKTGGKYVLPERILKGVIAEMGEDAFNKYLEVKWVVLTEEESKLAEEIKRELLTK